MGVLTRIKAELKSGGDGGCDGRAGAVGWRKGQSIFSMVDEFLTLTGLRIDLGEECGRGRRR